MVQRHRRERHERRARPLPAPWLFFKWHLAGGRGESQQMSRPTARIRCDDPLNWRFEPGVDENCIRQAIPAHSTSY
ncbi:hypothetical protein EVAR_6929_1 [Eumeta japonica]|uniref:Uncharacterized protein n=1 Tax=Eumeta variegata TaxID=151549 RepID=A0A4C1THB0_EUMVA|nr:hypothetical protein EVAR_6929_1 [Eumeta japonica]